MKKTDLKSCPDWLLKADTLDEDVEMDYGGIIIWKGGIWEDGTWEDGVWEDGVWEAGIWKDGTWEKGIWKAGYKRIGQCKWRCYYNAVSGYIWIGYMEKTIKDWDLFFESDEVLKTPRDTYEFFKIHQSYLVAKAAMEAEIKYGCY